MAMRLNLQSSYLSSFGGDLALRQTQSAKKRVARPRKKANATAVRREVATRFRRTLAHLAK
jgi:hypothetical protein